MRLLLKYKILDTVDIKYSLVEKRIK